MGTIVIGTIDLTALCGCPDPCPNCCGIACSPCASIPRALFATFSNTANCPELDGNTIPFGYDAGAGGWLSPNLPCGGGGFLGIMELDCASLQLSFCGFSKAPDSLTCTPFHAVYTVDVTGGNCCPDCAADPFTPTVFTVTFTA